MGLHMTIKSGIQDAMRAKEVLRLSVLRSLSAAFTNENVAQKRSPDAELSDEEAFAVVKRLAKQRREAAEQFHKGGRKELAAQEEKELAILETFLPRMMGKDEIRKIAEAKKLELGITDKMKLGMFVGTLMKELKGKADGNDVKEVVESLF